MTFSIDEARAGHALAEERVARAEQSLDRARGRRERRAAEEQLEQARSVLHVSRTMLDQLARELGVSPHASTTAPAASMGDSLPGQRAPRPMTRSAVFASLRSFGLERARQGDEFLENDYREGTFFYATGGERTGICVLGDEDDWVVSVFSAARVRCRPSLELYQFVSRWRTTAGAGAPYVVESDGEAAIMCERLFQGAQLVDGVAGRYMLESTIDIVGQAAQTIALYLQQSNDGTPFSATGIGGLMALMSWWDVTDERLLDALNRP